MNQRLVESVAQVILAMTAEERELLETMLQRSNGSPQTNQSTEEEKFLSVAEIAQDIQTFEKTYHDPSNGQVGNAKDAQPVVAKSTEEKKSAYSFFREAQSLQLEGPEDFSLNIDHYLYGLPKQDV